MEKPMWFKKRAGLVALSVLGVNFAAGGSHAASAPAYSIMKSIPLGSPERWDFLSFDVTSHRVYVAHNTEIVVVDGHTGEIVGRVGGLAGVNGVAVVPQIGKGYTDSRAKKAGIVFDLATFKVIKEVPANSDTDAVVYDPASRRVFIMSGDPHNITVIDTVTDTVVATVALNGVPEFAVADGVGNLYVNLEDTREIARIDTRSAQVTATWAIRECESPHGLSLDTRTHRLFSSCMNSKMIVVDSNNGRVIATVPIGSGTDASAFDPKRRLIFSSNGEGTLSVIRQQGSNMYALLVSIPTRPLARTMTLDPESGRIYLVGPDAVEKRSAASDPEASLVARPGSLRLYFLDPH
jgi:DNA-binding beta-propeller fold protein YncE